MNSFSVKTLRYVLKILFLMSIFFTSGNNAMASHMSRDSIQANNLLLSATLMDIFLVPSIPESSIRQESLRVNISDQQIYTKQINYDSSGLIEKIVSERIALEDEPENFLLLMMPNHFKLERMNTGLIWLSQVENDDIHLIRYYENFSTDTRNQINHIVRDVKPSKGQNIFQGSLSLGLTFGIDDHIIKIVDKSMGTLQRKTSYRYDNSGNVVKTIFVMHGDSLLMERIMGYRYNDHGKLIEISMQTTLDTGYNDKYFSPVTVLKPTQYNNSGDWITFTSEDGQLKLERVVSYY